MESVRPLIDMVQYKDLLSDTICSPITAPGYSGVAVLRISGDKAFEVAKTVSDIKTTTPESHHAYLANIFDKEGSKVDQVLLTYFSKGQSFTGDEVVELSCHGNPLLINAIMKSCLEAGCRTAERGEFSFRAYYNGKIDLIQAESIQQLVTSNTKVGSQAFLSQLEGRLSQEFNKIQDLLILGMAHLEASIDFVEQDIETAELTEVQVIVDQVKELVQALLNSYSTGKSLQESCKVVLLGQPNTGKSSLFNRLVADDRAIVTEIPGTTRDLITEQRFLGNHSLTFVDSAGLRSTDDQIEVIGINKGLASARESQIILFVLDSSNPEGVEFLKECPSDKTILVLNKGDLLDKNVPQDCFKNQTLNKLGIDLPEESVAIVSCLTGDGLNSLLDMIDRRVNSLLKVDETALVTQARHYNHLCDLSEILETASLQIKQSESPDIISQELLMGLTEIHQLLGKEYDDEVLDKIFSQFCIGK